MRLTHIGMWLALSMQICATRVSAQKFDTPRPLSSRADFSWIDVTAGAGIGQPTQGYDGWTPGPEPYLAVSTPFLHGRSDLRFSVRSWTSGKPDLPSFTAVFGSLGWARDMQWRHRITFAPGVRAGNHLMSFRTDQLAGQRIESEFAIEPFLGISTRLSERLALNVEGALQRVFTAPRLDNSSIRAGISWRFATPDGLRDFLR